MKSTPFFPLPLVCLTLGLGGQALASNYEESVRLGAKGAFGFGGEITSEVQGYGGDLEDDLEATMGFALFAHYPLHRNFHVGLQMGLGWVSSDLADDYHADSTFVLDISPVLKVRALLLNDKLELYALLPIGLTVSVPPDDRAFGLGEVETGIGWNAGLQAGVSYQVYDGVAISLELGWQGRGSTNDTAVNAELSTSMHQFALNFGFSYAL